MKKFITSIALIVVMASATFAEYRFVEETPNTNSVLSVPITAPSLLKSVYCTVSATSETNSFTITYVTKKDGVTNTLATPVADVIQGEAFPAQITYYNYDSDSSTGDTEWLQPGDTLLLTSNDATNTDYSNVTYRVSLEVDRARSR